MYILPKCVKYFDLILFYPGLARVTTIPHRKLMIFLRDFLAASNIGRLDGSNNN